MNEDVKRLSAAQIALCPQAESSEQASWMRLATVLSAIQLVEHLMQVVADNSIALGHTGRESRPPSRLPACMHAAACCNPSARMRTA